MHIDTLAFLGVSLFSLAASAAGPPGLLMVLSKPTHPELTEATFNEWYSGPHIRDMVASGVTDLVLRYKNVNASAKYPYLALYRLPDAAKLADPSVMGSIPATSPLLPGKEKGSKGGKYTEVMDMGTSAYARTQTFEGPGGKSGRGKALVTAAIQPANGTDAEFDDWYRKQHLDMLSMLPAYRRSTRYQKLDGSSPKYLAMHEVDSAGLGPDMKVILGTEWSMKIMKGATVRNSDVWEFVAEFGKAGVAGEKF